VFFFFFFRFLKGGGDIGEKQRTNKNRILHFFEFS